MANSHAARCRSLVAREPTREGDQNRPKMVSYGRYVTFQLAEVAVPRELFWKMRSQIDDLRPKPAPA